MWDTDLKMIKINPLEDEKMIFFKRVVNLNSGIQFSSDTGRNMIDFRTNLFNISAILVTSKFVNVSLENTPAYTGIDPKICDLIINRGIYC